MKIAFFSYWMLEGGGGISKYFTDVSRGLKKEHPDLKLSIITFDERFLKKILFLYNLYFLGKQDKNVYKESTTHIKDKLGPVEYYKAKSLGDLKQKLQSFDRIYISNNLLELIMVGVLFRFSTLPPTIIGFHVPLVYTSNPSLQSKLHNLLYTSNLYARALKQARTLHVLNSFDEMFLKKRFPKKKIIKIVHPFNAQEFRQKAATNKYKYTWDVDKTHILWLGRLTEQKGVNDLITIVNNMNKSKIRESVLWHIIGDGELKNQIIKLQEDWKNVHYLGYIAHNYVPSILRHVDLFISTSIWEALPYNILEAQSFGIPVISYDIQGNQDIVKHNRTGYLVSNRSQFQARIKQFVAHNSFDKKSIKLHVDSLFDYQKTLAKIYALLID